MDKTNSLNTAGKKRYPPPVTEINPEAEELVKDLLDNEKRVPTLLKLNKAIDMSTATEESIINVLSTVYGNFQKILQLVKGEDTYSDALILILISNCLVLNNECPTITYEEADNFSDVYVKYVEDNLHLFERLKDDTSCPTSVRLRCLVRLSRVPVAVDNSTFRDFVEKIIKDFKFIKGNKQTKEFIEDEEMILDYYDADELMNIFFTLEDLKTFMSGFAESLGIKLEHHPIFVKNQEGEVPYGGMRYYYSRLFYNILSLEQREPGCVRILQEEFGITYFQRYPISALLETYRNRNEDLPYGVLISSNYDENGALDHDDHLPGPRSNYLSTLTNDLNSHGYTIRIIEVNSKRDLAKKVLTLDSKYGDSNKISFVIADAHGDEKDGGIVVGFGNEKVTGDVIMELKTQNLQRLFVSNPTFISTACFSGVENGPVQILNRKANGKYFAPKKLGHALKKVDTIWKGGKPSFSIISKKGRTSLPDIPVVS